MQQPRTRPAGVSAERQENCPWTAKFTFHRVFTCRAVFFLSFVVVVVVFNHLKMYKAVSPWVLQKLAVGGICPAGLSLLTSALGEELFWSRGLAWGWGGWRVGCPVMKGFRAPIPALDLEPAALGSTPPFSVGKGTAEFLPLLNVHICEMGVMITAPKNYEH